jgi:tripartite-type tricarboxylate transporter receptor subunit TctC
MNFTNRIGRRSLIALAAVASATLALPALAQGAFPNKPIRIVVPFAAGTGSDVIARTVGQKVSEESKQPVIVDTKEGGGGIVGTLAALQAPNDGYTMLMVANPFTIVPGTNSKAPYDPLKDFVPVAKVAIVPIVFTVANNLPVNNLREFIAYAKANPGKLSYASSGPGTPSQLEMELFKQAAGLDIVEVPYKSTAQAMTDVIGGQIALYPSAMPLSLQHVKAGKVKALALFNTQRSPALPDVPTLGEGMGMPSYVATPLWYGFVARAGTPPEAQAKLHALVTQAMKSAEVAERLQSLGAQLITPTNDEFSASMKAETEKTAKIAKTLGIAK